MIEFQETYAYTMAHNLPTFPDGHKCRRVHGHLCEVTIVVRAGSDAGGGYWLDHAELGRAARGVLRQLDHRMINEIPGLEDGLAESQIAWLVDRIRPAVAALGGVLLELHHDEWSSGEELRKVRHRKTWRSAE